jgi:ATP-dependent RNA helicase DHX29
VEDSVEDRRAGFVDLLLKADGSSSSAVDATTSSQETLKITDVKETKDSGADAKVESMFFLVVVNFAVHILY